MAVAEEVLEEIKDLCWLMWQCMTVLLTAKCLLVTVVVVTESSTLLVLNARPLPICSTALKMALLKMKEK